MRERVVLDRKLGLVLGILGDGAGHGDLERFQVRHRDRRGGNPDLCVASNVSAIEKPKL